MPIRISPGNTLENQMRGLLQKKRMQVEQAVNQRVLQQPHEILRIRQQTLDSYAERLDKSMQQIQMVKQHQFEIITEKLAMLSPLAVLRRGYSIVRDKKGQLIKDKNTVQPGAQLEIILNQGMINVEVINAEEGSYGTRQKER